MHHVQFWESNRCPLLPKPVRLQPAPWQWPRKLTCQNSSLHYSPELWANPLNDSMSAALGAASEPLRVNQPAMVLKRRIQ